MNGEYAGVERAVLLIIGVVDPCAAQDLRAKFDALCGYRHVRCIVVDLRAAIVTDELWSELLAQLRERAGQCEKDLIVQDATHRTGLAGVGPVAGAQQ